MIPDWDWRARFDAFAARKTRAAAAARLFPFVTIENIGDTRMQRVGSPWSLRLFDGPFYVARTADRARPTCSLVFVQSADGNTGADDPASLGGGETDKHLVYEGLSRVAADAVLAGARTVGAGDLVFSVWHPQMVALRASLGLSRHPTQIVLTNGRLDVDGMLIFNVPEIRVVLLTGPLVPPEVHEAIRVRPWIEHMEIPAGGGIPVAFERLRGIGITTISCVGGRTTARQLLADRLIDHVYLTTAPAPGGESDTPIAPWPWRGTVILRKRGSGPEAGVVFEQIVPDVPISAP